MFYVRFCLGICIHCVCLHLYVPVMNIQFQIPPKYTCIRQIFSPFSEKMCMECLCTIFYMSFLQYSEMSKGILQNRILSRGIPTFGISKQEKFRAWFSFETTGMFFFGFWMFVHLFASYHMFQFSKFTINTASFS